MKERTKEELLIMLNDPYRKNTVLHEVIYQLLAEMEKPRLPEIDWQSRPWATEVRIGYANGRMCYDKIGDRIETIRRPVTKTRAREIAEETKEAYHKADGSEMLADMIEAAILRREKELEEGR